MFKKIKKITFMLIASALIISSVKINADITDEAKKNFSLQRTISGVFDNQENTISNLQFYTTKK